MLLKVSSLFCFGILVGGVILPIGAQEEMTTKEFIEFMNVKRKGLSPPSSYAFGGNANLSGYNLQGSKKFGDKGSLTWGVQQNNYSDTPAINIGGSYGNSNFSGLYDPNDPTSSAIQYTYTNNLWNTSINAPIYDLNNTSFGLTYKNGDDSFGLITSPLLPQPNLSIGFSINGGTIPTLP